MSKLELESNFLQHLMRMGIATNGFGEKQFELLREAVIDLNTQQNEI